MPSDTQSSFTSPDEELALLMDLLDDAASPSAEERLRSFYAPRISGFLRKQWPFGLSREIRVLTDWVIKSFVEGIKTNTLKGDEPIAMTMIRLAKNGLLTYAQSPDGILPTPPDSLHVQTPVWLDWELLRLDGRDAEVVAHIRNFCSSKSELHRIVLRVMCKNGLSSEVQLVGEVRQECDESSPTAMDILSIRDELRAELRSKINQLRKR